MGEPSQLELKAEIHELVLRYWRDVDMSWGENAHNFFAEDGSFESENMHLKGRDEIRSFYKWRRDRGERVARHVVNNALVELDGDRASISYLMMIFAADGVPVLTVSSPNLILDVREILVRRDGGWLIERKVFTTLFKGEVPATVMPKELLQTHRKSSSGRAVGSPLRASRASTEMGEKC